MMYQTVAVFVVLLAAIFTSGYAQGPPGVNGNGFPPRPPNQDAGPPGFNFEDNLLEYPTVTYPPNMDGIGGELNDQLGHGHSDPRGPISYEGRPLNEPWRRMMIRKRRPRH